MAAVSLGPVLRTLKASGYRVVEGDDLVAADLRAALPEGEVPVRSLRTEVEWARSYLGPWVGRRLTGRSSGDGVVAKRPGLSGWRPPA